MTGGRVFGVNCHDFNPTVFVANTQATCIDIDGNRVGGLGSTRIDFSNIRGRNILIARGLIGPGPRQFTVQQTDLMTLGTPGGWTGFTIRDVQVDGVGEPFDIWSDGNRITDVVIRNAYVRAISLKYGARQNVISHVRIDGTALAGLFISPMRHVPGVADRYPERNVFSDVVIAHAGALIDDIYGNSPEGAVQVQGSNGAPGSFDPRDNTFDGVRATGSGRGFPWVFVSQDAGPGNVFRGEGAASAAASG
ncbi:MAG: hypothetical protein WDM92_12190 [Caulobacteraceae bacterium]